RLTGLRVERRAEGVLLVDTTSFSSERFPGTGSVAQAAVLLAVEMADRVVDPDGRRVKRMTPPDPRDQQERLVGQIDAGLPTATLIPLDGTDSADDVGDVGAGLGPAEPVPAEEVGEDDTGKLPFITDSFLRTAVSEILQRYASAFGAQWHADQDRLRTEAVAVLERLRAGTSVPGGGLGRPLVGRFRTTVATIKKRATLF